MKKQNRFAVCADFRLAVAENARTLRLEFVARNANVRHFVTNVMDAAVGIALKEFCDRRSPAPNGSRSSILVFGSVMNTVETP